MHNNIVIATSAVGTKILMEAVKVHRMARSNQTLNYAYSLSESVWRISFL